MTTSSKIAIIAGGTGLVGSSLLSMLLKHPHYGKIIALTRKKVCPDHPKLTELVVDFNKLKTYASLLKGNDIFCCLGTTIRKAGSQAAFRKVDLDYPLQIATIGHQQGVSGYYLVSSMGADAESVIFYNRTKGQLEEALMKLHFKRLHIFRPSLLLGDRKERRMGEKLGQIAMSAGNILFVGPLKKYRAIQAADVASAMLHQATMEKEGTHIYPSDRIQTIANTIQ